MSENQFSRNDIGQRKVTGQIKEKQTKVTGYIKDKRRAKKGQRRGTGHTSLGMTEARQHEKGHNACKTQHIQNTTHTGHSEKRDSRETQGTHGSHLSTPDTFDSRILKHHLIGSTCFSQLKFSKSE